MKSKRALACLEGLLVVAGVCGASDARAWSTRWPALGCQISGSQSTFLNPPNPPTTDYDPEWFEPGTIATVCPFIDSGTNFDSTITSIGVDLFVQSGAPAAGAVQAMACRVSNWIVTCGTTAKLPAKSTQEVLLNVDPSQWANDTANGYTYVYVTSTTTAPVTIQFLGIFLTGTGGTTIVPG